MRIIEIDQAVVRSYLRMTSKRLWICVFFKQVGVFFGGLPIQKDEEVLKNTCPHIVVGTPGRILALVRSKKLNLKHLKHFVLDECDKMLELLGKKKISKSTLFHRDTSIVSSYDV